MQSFGGGWIECFTEEGDLYYYNHISGKTTTIADVISESSPSIILLISPSLTPYIILSSCHSLMPPLFASVCIYYYRGIGVGAPP